MILNDLITLDGIKQDLYFEGKFNAQTFNQSDLNRIINKYYQQMQSIVRGINENFYLIVATTDLVIGDGSYTFPNGDIAPPYEKIKSIWVSLMPQDITAPTAKEYDRVNIIDSSQVTNPAYEFTIPTAIIFGNYMVLHPLVTNTSQYPVTDGVKMYYVPQLDKLVLDTDKPNIFPDYHDYITWGVLTEIAGPRLSNWTLQARAEKKFKSRGEDLATFASGRIVDPQAGDVIEGQDTSGGWAYAFGQQSMS